MRKALIAFALAFAALSAGCSEDPPSCQQAVGSYYGAGCVFTDGAGTTFTEAEVVFACRADRANLPASCQDDLDAFLICLDERTGPGDCDCSVEQERLLTCQ